MIKLLGHWRSRVSYDRSGYIWIQLCDKGAATEGYGLCTFALYGINYVESQKETLLPSEWENEAMNRPCGSSIFNESLKLSVLDTMTRTAWSKMVLVLTGLGH